MKYTIVIQGPQKNINQSLSLCGLAYYKTIASVIVSHWDNDPQIETPLSDGVLIIRNPRPAVMAYNNQNIYLHCLSTLAGLREVQTEYVIKTRSDQNFSNAFPIFEIVEKSCDKIITNNVYFRKESEIKFHPSDQFIVSKTKDLLGTFEMLKTMLENHDPASGRVLAAEQWICTALLKFRDIKVDPERSAAIMLENYDIVSNEDINLQWGKIINGDIVNVNNQEPFLSGMSEFAIDALDTMLARYTHRNLLVKLSESNRGSARKGIR